MLDLKPMNELELRHAFRFVEYGTAFEPSPGTIVLDVGRKTVPGVIDHHQADAEPECTASLLAKYPNLILDHVPFSETNPLTFITHKLPDFDALASIFLTLRLIETRTFDEGMAALAAYTKIVDSSSLPRKTDLAATPYGILRGLFAGAKSPLLLGSLVALASIVAPITEELIFRAGLFRYARTRLPRWAALLLPAVLFGALHGNLASFPQLVALGVIFSLAYERTGNIAVPMLAHALFNLNTIALILSGIDL